MQAFKLQRPYYVLTPYNTLVLDSEIIREGENYYIPCKAISRLDLTTRKDKVIVYAHSFFGRIFEIAEIPVVDI